MVLLLLGATRASAFGAEWQGNASGQPQLTPCGEEFFWPHNSNWSQTEAYNSCTEDGVVRRYVYQPSNWDTPVFPNGPMDIANINGHAPTILDTGVSVGEVNVGGAGVLEIIGSGYLTIHGVGTFDTEVHGQSGIETRDGGTAINNGRIRADVSGATLGFYGSGVFVNNGEASAVDGGRLLVGAEVINNGTLRAEAGSLVSLYGGTVVGGELVTDGDGRIVVEGSSKGTIKGDIQNNADFVVEWGNLKIGGDTTLTGVGHLTVTNNGYVYGVAENDEVEVFRIGSGHLLNGDGSVGSASASFGALEFVNDGEVRADVLGGTFHIIPADGVFVNNGVASAVDGGRLLLAVGTHMNNGTIRAEAGSLVSLYGGTVVGGEFATDGDGKIVVEGGAAGTIAGDIQNNANFVVEWGNLKIGGDTTLTGVGHLTVTNNGYVYGVAENDEVELFRIGSGHLLNGDGSVGSASASFGALDFVNDGEVRADVSGGTFHIMPADGLFTNNGVASAADGGRLQLGAGTHINNGTLLARAGSTVSFFTAKVIGGEYATDGDGMILVQAGSTISGDIRNNANFVVGDRLSIGGDASITGIGNVTVTSNGYVVGSEDNEEVDVLRIGDGQLLNGGGTVGTVSALGDLDFISDGQVRADVPGGTLRIVPGEGRMFVNNGEASALDGATLFLGDGRHVNNGNVVAMPGGTVTVWGDVTNLGSLAVQDGTLNLSGSIVDGDGQLVASGGSVTATNSTVELGSVELTGSTLLLTNSPARIESLVADEGSNLAMYSPVEVGSELSFEMSAPGSWSWRSLTLSGGINAAVSNFLDWVTLEVGGEDLGVDSEAHVGAASGFTDDNFYLPTLVIGPGTNAYLVDAFDNAGDGDDVPDSLYVGELVFEDESSTLNLNGLHLYYRSIAGSVSQIIDVDVILPGDFDDNSLLSDADVDLLIAAVRVNSMDDARLDLNADNQVDFSDVRYWVENIANTYFGDSNVDGVFDSGDLIRVFQDGQYEDGVADNSGWANGDWNGDGEFNSSDLIIAFQDGGYDIGPRESAEMVPEPAVSVWGVFGVVLLSFRWRLCSA